TAKCLAGTSTSRSGCAAPSAFSTTRRVSCSPLTRGPGSRRGGGISRDGPGRAPRWASGGPAGGGAGRPEGPSRCRSGWRRGGDAVEVRYAIEDGPAELAALVFLPPGREVLAGVMGAAPEGPGFRVTFHDLRITEPDWSAPADDAITWRDNQAGWARD